MPNTPAGPKKKATTTFSERKQERIGANSSDWTPKEHHCGICKQPTSHPTTKGSCLRDHEEVCELFHTTLHFVDKSNECKPCVFQYSMKPVELINIIDAYKRKKPATDGIETSQSSSLHCLHQKKQRP